MRRMTLLVRLRRSGYRSNPWLIRLTRFRALVKVCAVPRNGLALRACEHNLEQLHGPGSESGDGTGEVEPPHAGELRSVLRLHLLIRVLEALEPILKCARVVHAQVFDVEHGEVLRLEDVHHAAQRRRMPAGKDAALDPEAERPIEIAADEVQ